MKQLKLLLIAVASLLMYGCGSDEPDTPDTPDINVEGSHSRADLIGAWEMKTEYPNMTGVIGFTFYDAGTGIFSLRNYPPGVDASKHELAVYEETSSFTWSLTGSIIWFKDADFLEEGEGSLLFAVKGDKLKLGDLEVWDNDDECMILTRVK